MKPTQEQVIAWAREAGFSRNWQGTWHGIFAQMNEAFTLAYEAGRKDENEECAKVCELIAINAADSRASECAAAIRARGEQ